MKSHSLRALALLLALAALCLTLTGCSPSVVGKWATDGNQDTVFEFTADGKLVVSSNGLSLTGTYKIDGAKIEVTMQNPLTGEKNTSASDFSLVGDTLTVDGSAMHRVK